MIVLIFLTLFSVFSLLVFHLGARMLFWAGVLGLTPWPLLFHALHFLVAFSYMLAYPLKRSRWKRGLTILGSWWMGIFWYGLVVLTATDLLLLLSRRLGIPRTSDVDAALPAIALLLLLLLTALLCIGRRTALHLAVTSYAIAVPKRSATRSVLSIALLSDLHLGAVNGIRTLQRIQAVLAEDPPDLLLIAGDLFDGDLESLPHPAEAAALLRSMQGTLGTYACLGNHDAGRSFAAMLDFYERAGIHLLQDEATVVEDTLLVLGRRDRSPIGDQGQKRLPPEAFSLACPPSLPFLILDHQPSRLREALSLGADLLLCGHTHQGQIFPFAMVTKRLFPVDYGYLRLGDLQAVVSSGAGTWGPPLRLGTRSEVVRIQLRMET